MITTHPAYPELQKLAKAQDKTIHMVLADLLEQLRVEEATAAKRALDDFSLTEVTKDLHFYPDLHGKPITPSSPTPRMIDIVVCCREPVTAG